MKRFFVLMTAAAAGLNLSAQEVDSVRVYELQQIEIVATRAAKTTPVAFSTLSERELAKNNLGQDIPYMLQMTPSFIATSEAGNGIGATSMRLRGTDATRLNVTANGVSLNNPDSHSVYWYDTPDFISSVGSVQIQRGAGTSTNGTGAFGGALNMTTAPLGTSFGGVFSSSYGSFNTSKQSLQIGSGLIGDHWIFDGRVSHISSDGYVDRGDSDMFSYMFQGGYYNANTSVKFLTFGGHSKVYLTYTGATKEEMEAYGRKYHTDGQYYTSDGPYVLDDGSHVNYYDDHTDNYTQLNNQLIYSHSFNEAWKVNAVAFYTYGYGFYKQYKDNAKLLEHGFSLADSYTLSGSKIRKDLIRRKVMRNNLYGANASAVYTNDWLNLIFGGSTSWYSCPHWGELDWVQDNPNGFSEGMHWYDNDVDKYDGNAFVKATAKVADGLNVSGELQYRGVKYKAWGVNDNWDDAIDGMQKIDVDETYNFFNPKFGVDYQNGHNRVYASFAVAQKEPTRSDFTDRFRDEFPKPEKMYDWEMGYVYNGSKVYADANLYYMKYKDQLVKTGQINESYDALNINVPDSYRKGIELSLAYNPWTWLTMGGNYTLSRNRIKNYTNKVVDYDSWDDATNFYGYHIEEMGDTPISYSPEHIGNAFVEAEKSGVTARLSTKFVSDQYFTNYRNDNMKLDGYCTTDLLLSYTMRTGFANEITFGVTVYNLFNAKYCVDGYGYSEYYGGQQYDYAYYFPQATRNFIANITVKF